MTDCNGTVIFTLIPSLFASVYIELKMREEEEEEQEALGLYSPERRDGLYRREMLNKEVD